MDRTTLLNGFRLNMDYTLQLVADVAECDMTEQPKGFANHPAFTLGHLVTATALSIEVLTGEYEVPDGWDELFRRKGPGDPTMPEQDVERYPGKAALVSTLQKKADLLARLIESADDEAFEQPCRWKLERYMPTNGQVLYFQCMLHHSWHIGQLAEWRRLMGYDSALKRLMDG